MALRATHRQGMNRSEGEEDSGAENRRRAVGLQCFKRRFSYSGLNILVAVGKLALCEDEFGDVFVGVNELRS